MRGLRAYLDTYSFDAASTGNFWGVQQGAARAPVATMGETLTKVQGMPLIVVENDADGTCCSSGHTGGPVVRQVPVFGGALQSCDQDSQQPVWLQTWQGELDWGGRGEGLAR